MKETNVTINVTLDENNIPEKIIWSAPDGGVSDFPAKAMLLTLWDSNNKESLKMDLWVKDMPVEEMKNFILQSQTRYARTTKILILQSQFRYAETNFFLQSQIISVKP